MLVYTTGEKNDRWYPIGASGIPVGIGYPKGNGVALGGGIQRGQRPFWHTTFLGKSSVLYLCFRLTLERGWLRHLRHGQMDAGRRFSAAVGQADFVRTRTKYGFAHRAKSA